ncbi:hypothetical protein D3C83_29010 [compost metagenome]
MRAPGDHEDGLDVEDDEQHRDHVELDREPLPRVAQRRHAGFVGRLLHRRGPRAHGEVGYPQHQHRVEHHKSEQQQDG